MAREIPAVVYPHNMSRVADSSSLTHLTQQEGSRLVRGTRQAVGTPSGITQVRSMARVAKCITLTQVAFLLQEVKEIVRGTRQTVGPTSGITRVHSII